MVKEPQAQWRKVQKPWPAQWVQQVALTAKAGQVVLEVLVAQVALGSRGNPKALASQERKMPQLVAFPIHSGHPIHQGLVARGPGNPLLQFTFPCPLLLPMEVEIAHQFLIPNAELSGTVQK